MTPNAQQRKMLRHMLMRRPRPYYAPLNCDAHKDLIRLAGYVDVTIDGSSVVARLTKRGVEMVEKMG